MKRVGKPEDIAGAIAFLCSEDAGYVSGQVDLRVRRSPRAFAPGRRKRASPERVLLVTGGGLGLGAATSERFAAEGGAVVVVDLDGRGGTRRRGEASLGRRSRVRRLR